MIPISTTRGPNELSEHFRILRGKKEIVVQCAEASDAIQQTSMEILKLVTIIKMLKYMFSFLFYLPYQ